MCGVYVPEHRDVEVVPGGDGGVLDGTVGEDEGDEDVVQVGLVQGQEDEWHTTLEHTHMGRTMGIC